MSVVFAGAIPANASPCARTASSHAVSGPSGISVRITSVVAARGVGAASEGLLDCDDRLPVPVAGVEHTVRLDMRRRIHRITRADPQAYGREPADTLVTRGLTCQRASR